MKEYEISLQPPKSMTTPERLDEVAKILSNGIIRIKRKAARQNNKIDEKTVLHM